MEKNKGINVISNAESFLPDSDRRIIEKGLRTMADYLTDKNPFPKVFIFPETGARPLLYAARPVIAHLSGQRHIETPHFVHVNLADRSFFLVEDKISLQRRRDSRRALQAQSAELVKWSRLKEGDEVMVIDEYVSDLGVTFTEIDEAMQIAAAGRGISSLPVNAFAFIGEDEAEYLEAKVSGELIVGVVQNDPDYRVSAFVFDYRMHKTQADLIGFEKDDKGLRVNKAANLARMVNLRSELKEIGEEFVKQLS